MFQPMYRPRRLRANENIRRMVRETKLSPDDFIYPLFVTHGKGVKKEISSMPGNFQQSIENIVKDCEEVQGLGIPAVLLFGIPEHKDEVGSEAYSDEGIVQHAIKAIKNKLPELIVITDVCLCEYTSHGHCGVIKNGTVQNDATLELLAKEALSHAKAGADMVAPSDMMDGRVGAITAYARQRGILRYADHVLRSQICVKFLRSLPRGSGIDAAVRRPTFIPDGRSEQPRGLA